MVAEREDEEEGKKNKRKKRKKKKKEKRRKMKSIEGLRRKLQMIIDRLTEKIKFTKIL